MYFLKQVFNKNQTDKDDFFTTMRKTKKGLSPTGSLEDALDDEGFESIKTPMKLLKNRRISLKQQVAVSYKENESPNTRRMKRHMAGNSTSDIQSMI